WYFAGKVQFDADLMNLNYMSSHSLAAQKKFNAQNDFALSKAFVVAEGPSEAAASEKLSRIETLLEQLEDSGKIRDFRLPTEILPSPSRQAERLNQWEAYWDSGRIEDAFQRVRNAGLELGFAADAFLPFLETLRKPYTPLDSAASGYLKGLMPDAYGH